MLKKYDTHTIVGREELNYESESKVQPEAQRHAANTTFWKLLIHLYVTSLEKNNKRRSFSNFESTYKPVLKVTQIVDQIVHQQTVQF